jgi:hypothetical protein
MKRNATTQAIARFHVQALSKRALVIWRQSRRIPDNIGVSRYLSEPEWFTGAKN